MEKSIEIKHVNVQIESDFGTFTTALENMLGKITKEDFEYIARNPHTAEAHIKRLEGHEGLILFNTYNHGALFGMIGKQISAKLYLIGNPLYAFQMTQLNISAALYGPVKVLVCTYENDTVHVEYDLPSAVLNLLENAHITEFARKLDGKFERLIKAADQKK